jgi:hypothetical protein
MLLISCGKKYGQACDFFFVLAANYLLLKELTNLFQGILIAAKSIS